MKKSKSTYFKLPKEINDNIPKEFKPAIYKNDENKNDNITSAFDLFKNEQKVIPKLLDPFYQKVGLAALVGPSDTGKSTLLRQLALFIALRIETFLNFEIDAKHNKVLCITTEDDSSSVSFAIRKQAKILLNDDPNLSLEHLKNLIFSFSPDNPLEVVSEQLSKTKFDLVIIDAFADVFSGEINANTQVRKFLNDFDKLAKKHNCLILFLHHIGKNKEKSKAHKDNIIGSQAFEAKMRSVLELRMNKNDDSKRDLWVLKGNFLGNDFKKKSYVLNFDENLLFENSNYRGTGSINKTKNPEVIEKITELFNEGLTDREIAERLDKTNYNLKKSSVNNITKQLRSEK